MADQQLRGHVSRQCQTCGLVDDHPRHIVYDVIADPRTPGKFIDLSTERHIDCCAAVGCEQDGSCHRILAHVEEVAGKPLKGDKLRAHIIEHGDTLAEQHEQAAIARLHADHGQERIERYLSGGPLYLEHEAAELHAAQVRSWRELVSK